MSTLPPCVLDASVLVKLFLPEVGSTDVADLMTVYASGDHASAFRVPDLLFIECANILWKRVKRAELTADLALAHLADLRLLALPSVPTVVLMEPALTLAVQFGLTAYDGCYLALAAQHGIPFVTADARLRQTLQHSPFVVLALEDYLARCM